MKASWYEPVRTFGHKPYVRKNPRSKSSGLWHFDDASRKQKIQISDGSDGGRYPTTVLEYGVVGNSQRRHPTEKPADLLAQLIRCHCPPQGTVLDFCMGSGSTGMAALSTGRRFVGMELDKTFFDAAAAAIFDRWKTQPAELLIEHSDND